MITKENLYGVWFFNRISLQNKLGLCTTYHIILFGISSIKDGKHQGMKDKNVSCRQVWILDLYDSYSSVFELIAICVILLCQL